MLNFLKRKAAEIKAAFDAADESLVIESPAGLQSGRQYVAERRGNQWIVTRGGRTAFGPYVGPGACEHANKMARAHNRVLRGIENRRIRERYAEQNHAS